MRNEACLEQERLFPRQLMRIYKDSETPTNQWVELPPNLATICLDLRASISGAADPWQTKDLEEVVNMLKMRLESWFASKDPMDGYVNLMMHYSIELGLKELERRKL